jgi:hypothetical protein
MTVSKDRIDQILELLGAESNIANRQQLSVLLSAFGIFVERNRERGSVWANSGARGCAFHVFSMAERLWYQVMRKDPKGVGVNLDHAYDTINYAAMLVQQLHTSNFNGEWPWEVVNAETQSQ